MTSPHRPLPAFTLLCALPLAACGGGDDDASAAVERLPRSTPEAQGVRSEGLLSLVEALDEGIDSIHGLVLVRHGQVVAEGYRQPYAPDLPHVLYSVTKSFNATAVGFAVDEGLLSVDDLVIDHFRDIAPASPSPGFETMRVRDLLTMSTGHVMDTMDGLRAREDGQWMRAFLETEVPRTPGAFFLYNSGAAYALSALVQEVTGQSVLEYLTPRLFEPLDIRQPRWGMSPEGVNLGAGGLYASAEDLAKFGQLYLDRGRFGGEQLLSEEWVQAATQSQITTGGQDGNWNFGYGYQFWRNPVGGFRADGSLGQFSIVLPDQDVVLAITSGTTDLDQLMTLVWQNLMPALESEPLPENPDALAALQTELDSLSVALPNGSAAASLESEVSGRRFEFSGGEGQISAATLDFSDAGLELSLEDSTGTHVIALGAGEWLSGRTTYLPRINELFDVEDQSLAASYAWSDDLTLVARLCFNETPYTQTLTFRFADDRLTLEREFNVRWGDRRGPVLTAPR